MNFPVRKWENQEGKRSVQVTCPVVSGPTDKVFPSFRWTRLCSLVAGRYSKSMIGVVYSQHFRRYCSSDPALPRRNLTLIGLELPRPGPVPQLGSGPGSIGPRSPRLWTTTLPASPTVSCRWDSWLWQWPCSPARGSRSRSCSCDVPDTNPAPRARVPWTWAYQSRGGEGEIGQGDSRGSSGETPQIWGCLREGCLGFPETLHALFFTCSNM